MRECGNRSVNAGGRRNGRGAAAIAAFAITLVIGLATALEAHPRARFRQTSSGQNGAASTASRLEFEVASIKPGVVDPKAGGGIKVLPGGQSYVAENVPLKLMILLMYHLNETQVTGAPTWVDNDVFDVEGKADAPHTLPELRTMFQNLIVERFKLQFHYETRTLPMYALTVDKSGSKMKANSEPETFGIPVQRAGFGKWQATHCSMSHFAWFLSELPQLTRPVADETGLDGFYDFTLEYMPEARNPGEAAKAAAIASGPDLMTALREQLGLKLEQRKGPVQVMVIDHVEKPAQN